MSLIECENHPLILIVQGKLLLKKHKSHDFGVDEEIDETKFKVMEEIEDDDDREAMKGRPKSFAGTNGHMAEGKLNSL